MEPQFWHEQWRVTNIPFNQNKVNHYLTKYGGQLASGTVLVPLCGKSIDMLWLEASGHPVMGVELSALACQAFFEEQNRPYEKVDNGKFTLYRGGQVTLWCGDIFDLTGQDCQSVGSVYDRACLVAFPAALRDRYVQHLKACLKSATSLLVISFEYPQEQMSGPPFSITSENMHAYFGQSTKWLESIAMNPSPFKGVPEIKETAYWIEHGKI